MTSRWTGGTRTTASRRSAGPCKAAGGCTSCWAQRRRWRPRSGPSIPTREWWSGSSTAPGPTTSSCGSTSRTTRWTAPRRSGCWPGWNTTRTCGPIWTGWRISWRAERPWPTPGLSLLAPISARGRRSHCRRGVGWPKAALSAGVGAAFLGSNLRLHGKTPPVKLDWPRAKAAVHASAGVLHVYERIDGKL